MKHYIASVYQASYLDDYNDGEVDGSFNVYRVEQKIFSDPTEAIKWFIEKYQREYPAEVIAAGQLACSQGMMTSPKDSYDFAPATEAETEQWKAGEIYLYNVEYQLHLEMSELLEEDALKKLLVAAIAA